MSRLSLPIRPLVLCFWLLVPAASGAAIGPSLASKAQPGLLTRAQAAPNETLAVWVSFADKGERGPGELSQRLAEAEAALSPRARARRLRAGVRPLVDYLDIPVHGAYLEALAARGLATYGVSRWRNGAAVRIPGRALESLASLDFVRRLEAVERMRRSLDPGPAAPLSRAGATGMRQQVEYGLTTTQNLQLAVPSLHDSGYTGDGVLICVLDAGFNYVDKHEALRDHAIPPERQRDFHRGLQTVQDTTDGNMWHGTSVLGCIAGRAFGTYVGTAFDAEYALARTEVVEFERVQEMVYWGMGAEWADSLGADLISSSLGYSTFDPEDADADYTYQDMDGRTTVVSRAAQIAASKGILVVAAVGNEGGTAWRYLTAPSDVDGDSVIAVGAVDAAGTPTQFSSYGPSADGRVKPDLAARGVATAVVHTTGDPQAYASNNGTSFATPLVAGVAACLMEARPRWTPREVAIALRSTASRKAAPDARVGYGIPNAAAALAWNPAAGVDPGAALATIRHAGPNPVALARGPARFSIALSSAVCGRAGRVRVLDVSGRRVRDLWSGVVSCGLSSQVAWDGRDDQGLDVKSGLYLVELEAGGARSTLRLVALR